MFAFRRFAVLLALLLPVSYAAVAQNSSSSTESPQADQAQPAQAGQPAAAPQPAQAGQPAAVSQPQVSVAGRIRARREQRRQQAIRDAYSQKYEVFVGGGYQRFTPGPTLQKLTMYSWDVAVTRYWSEKLGLTVDGRGYYGTAFVGLNPTGLTRPSISHYDVLAGPTYRLMLRPKYSLAARAMGGMSHSKFAADTNGFGTATLGLYPDGNTYAIEAGILGEMNLSPNFSLRLAPEYYATGFGSKLQNDYGFTYGFVYRFGK